MGERYGLSTTDMLGALGPSFFIVPMLLWLLVIGPLLLYPVARWKAHRDQVHDNHLGLKVALHYFKMIALHLVLVGAFLLIYTVIKKSRADGGAREAFGFLVPGAAVFGLHIALLKRTNDDVLPNVRRLFLGYNVFVTGLIGLAALVMGCQALFAKGSTGDPGRMFLALVIVYCGAWAAVGFQFARSVFGDFTVPPAPPHAVAVPDAAPPAPSGPAGPQLPSLGGGSFPPIDQR